MQAAAKQVRPQPGVRTDDATGTIVFHLRRPDPDFLGSLVEWAPIPHGTPNHDLGRRPVPSTGPYMIESYVPKRTLTLVRNPYFHVWSRVASPDGFPEEIVIRLSGTARADAPGGGGAWTGRLPPHSGRHTRPDSRRATRRGCTCMLSMRRSSSFSTRRFRPSTTFASAAQSTLPLTARPSRGQREGLGSLR